MNQIYFSKEKRKNNRSIQKIFSFSILLIILAQVITSIYLTNGSFIHSENELDTEFDSKHNKVSDVNIKDKYTNDESQTNLIEDIKQKARENPVSRLRDNFCCFRRIRHDGPTEWPGAL